MDRRSLLTLGSAALGLTAKSLAADPADPAHPGWARTIDKLPGDPPETLAIWGGRVPPGGDHLDLRLQLIERSPTPHLFHDRFATGIWMPVLTVFRPRRPNGTALLIAPGGGYRRVVIDKEGFEAAHRFAAAGVTCFVLRYRLPGEGWTNGPDVPLQDAQRALRLIRTTAADFHVDRKRIGVLGFSAGGHVAASLITGFDRAVYAPADEIDTASARPDFAGLMYPVISMTVPVAHAGSREKMFGTTATLELEAAYSPDRHVTAATPPIFLTLAADDKEVDPQNSLAMLAALRAAGVPTEFHMFEEGGHGFGIRLIQGKPAAVWPGLFQAWARRHGMF